MTWAHDHGRKELIPAIAERREQAEQETEPSTNLPDFPNTVLEIMDGQVWKERLETDAAHPTSQALTMEAQSKRFLTLEEARNKAGQISVSEYDQVKRCLHCSVEILRTLAGDRAYREV